MAVIEPATYDPVTSGAYRKNPDGSVSTVKTATSEVDGNYMNYPTIQKSPSGNWVELPPAVALSNVLKSGQHLGVYDDEQEALDAAEQLHQSEAARLGMQAGFNAAMKAAKNASMKAAKNASDTFGVPVRPTYESEDDFFKGRPDVAGMATEDGSTNGNYVGTICGFSQAVTAPVTISNSFGVAINRSLPAFGYFNNAYTNNVKGYAWEEVYRDLNISGFYLPSSKFNQPSKTATFFDLICPMNTEIFPTDTDEAKRLHNAVLVNGYKRYIRTIQQ